MALVVSLSGGGGSALTLHTAVALTLRPATMPAPDENPHDGKQLDGDVSMASRFPYWEDLRLACDGRPR